MASSLVSVLTRLRRDAKSLANVRRLAEGHKCAHKKRVYDLLRTVRACAHHAVRCETANAAAHTAGHTPKANGAKAGRHLYPIDLIARTAF